MTTKQEDLKREPGADHEQPNEAEPGQASEPIASRRFPSKW